MSLASQRRYARVPIYKHARVETLVATAKTASKSIAAIVYELGAQGCGLRTEERIPVGTVVTLSLFDSTRLHPLVFEARVKWECEVEGTTVNSYGLQFVSIKKGCTTRSKEEIEKILQETGHRLACAS